MDFCRKTILLLIFASFMSIGWGQDCDENMFWTDCGLPFDCNPTCSNPNPPPDCLTVCEIGCFCNEGYIFSDDSFNECILTENCPEPSLCDEGYTEIDGECYYQSDLDVLQDIIDNSQGGDNPPPFDLSPIELCSQVWIDGRVVNLYCSGDDLEQDESYIDFELDIPESIGNLTSLMSIGLEYNNLSSLPESIGNLTNLTGLDVDNNQLTSLPESIGNLTNLTRLLLPVNQLTILPESICNLVENDCSIFLQENEICSPYPECIEDYVGYQDTSECGEPDPQIGDECVTQDGWIGFYDCELCCLDDWIIENWVRCK